MGIQKSDRFSWPRLIVVLASAVLALAAAAWIEVEVAQAGDCTLGHTSSWYFGADGRVNIRTSHSSRCSSGTHQVRGRNTVNNIPGGACPGNIASAGATSTCTTPYISYVGNRQNVVVAFTEAWKYNTVTKTWNWHQGPKVCTWTIDPPGHAPEPSGQLMGVSRCSN